MNNQLFRIVTELDYKFDIELKEYFNLTAEERDELGVKIAESLARNCEHNPVVLFSYIASIDKLIQDSEEQEEFEKCDIFKNIKNNIYPILYP